MASNHTSQFGRPSARRGAVVVTALAPTTVLALSLVLGFGGWGLPLGAQDAQESQSQSDGQETQASQTETQPERVVVYRRNGSPVEGRLVRQDSREVVIEVAGIEATFNMAQVLRVQPVPSVYERYQEVRARIADDDIEQLLLLADWLRDREAFSLALVEITRVLTQDPTNEKAKQLKTQVESAVMLRAEAVERAENAPSDAPGTSPRAPRATRANFPVLTPDQINLLKVYEVDLNDPPRLRVDRETIRRLVDAYPNHELIPKTREGRAALERRPAVHILELMFRLRAREFYNEVRVEDEPEAFGKFRENVHRAWLVTTCATSGCHGGQQAGDLWLRNISPNAPATIYTNFLILDRYRMADGTPLINYEEPAKSPLLQMALPREESLFPHPLVATGRNAVWRPVIGSQDDRRFQDALAWINAMYQPRPEYPVTYEPPKPTDGVPQLPNDPIGER